jgi:hypothetical protein
MKRLLRPGGCLVFSTPWAATGEKWKFHDDLVRKFGGRSRTQSLTAPVDMLALVRRAGFVDVETRLDEVRFVFDDLDTYWDWQLSHGFRAFFEGLAADDQGKFRAAVNAHLEELKVDGGIVLERGAMFTKARKPQ